MKYYCEEKELVLKELSASDDGLRQAEAERRLEQDGKNRLAAAKGKSLFRRFLEQLADPMILILLAAAAVSGVLAAVENDSFADVIIILAVVVINAILGVYQESKAEKAIEALQEMSAATSRVLRDGQIQTIPSEDLVKGDIILLEAGDAVPADARILESASLKVEEAALTGESVPVTKFIDMLKLSDGQKDVPLGDRKNMVYMGSTVVYGRGRAVVTATGMQTEMGKIADALEQAQEGQTPLQRKLSQLSRILTWIVLAICVVVFAVQIIRAGRLDLALALDSFMIAVSLAVAAIPEGLAAVVTVVLSIGVTNMSKRNAIIRRLTAVETLGCAQIICSDKTGTLTQNKMTVVDFFGEDETRIASAMALCSDAEQNADGTVTGEPTEAALVSWAAKTGRAKPELKAELPRCGEAPFDSGRKMMSTVHSTDNGYIQYTKGAPDVVTIRARSADFRGTLNSRREGSWHDTTLGTIVEAIASRNKLEASVAPSLAGIKIPHIDQSQESDAKFLTRLAERNGGEVSVKMGKLLFLKAGRGVTASGKKIPQVIITRSDGDRHHFAIADRGAYTGVTANGYTLKTRSLKSRR